MNAPTPRRALLGVGAAVLAAVVMFGVDAAAGGKSPIALTVVAFAGAVLLIAVSLAVPGGLLARPEGTRAGELGVEGDRASSLDANDATARPPEGSDG